MKTSLVVKYLVRACLLAVSCWVGYEVYILVGKIGLMLIAENSLAGYPLTSHLFTALGWLFGLVCFAASFKIMVDSADSPMSGQSVETEE